MLRTILVLCVIALLWKPVISVNKTAIVQTDSGPVRGEEVTFEGTRYKAFKGIPYAAPPIGELRFKAPLLPRKWTDIKEATNYGSVCPQPKFMNSSSEDCLTLNVFTQSIGQNELKPVLVLIYGGGFSTGSGTDGRHGPEYFVKQNVVFVTFNYRIGSLGFLATNTSDATGNWGLKDQVAALKWVKSNIAQFGGDPKKVTLYGYSAGGASVHLHLFSPLSKGLFQQAIISSGSGLVAWALDIQNRQERYSRNLARLLGASEEAVADPKKRIQFVRTADSKDLILRAYDVFDKEDFSNPLFRPLASTPVIEPSGTEGAFLTEDPWKQLAEGRFNKVPIMMGMNDLEGSLLYGFGKNFTSELRKEIEDNVCQILPQPVKDAVIAKNECSKVAQLIRNVYFDGNGFDSSFLSFVKLWGDVYMTKDMYFTQRMHAKHAGEDTPLYNYYFTFDGEWNMEKKRKKIQLPGAAHADDLLYMFVARDYKMPVLPDSSPEVITKNRMISFMTNFVKTGNPTPSVSDLVPVKWEPSKENDFSTMVIRNELTLEKEFLKTRMELWDQLHDYCSKDSISSAEANYRLISWKNVWILACTVYLATVRN